MFVSDHLIYLQLPKTACSHIAQLLLATVGGTTHGVHGRAEWVYRSGHFLLGSIRNPWDWYVSLWAYSCSGEGQLFHRTTHRYALRRLAYKIRRDRRLRVRHVREFLHHSRRPVDEWRQTYRDPHDPANFRRWLRLMCDPIRAHDLAAGFGESAVSSYAGLLTFQYSRLFCDDVRAVEASGTLPGQDDLRTHVDDHWALDGVVRTENLEADLIAAIEDAGLDLSPDQETWIHGQRREKRNTSEHAPPSSYYDSETSEMVSQWEGLIIERHGYSGPSR